MVVKFRLKQLIAEREFRTGERVTYKVIQDATGINQNTITAMANNQMSQVGLSTIDRLCDFFQCDIADLMVRE